MKPMPRGAAVRVACAVAVGLALLALGGVEELGAQAASPPSRVLESATGVEGRLAAAPGAQPVPEVAGGITPRGAFIRSLVVPGWGHMAADAPGRAAFYVAAQGGTYWMLAKSLIRRRNAVRYRDSEFDLVVGELRASGMMNPDSLRFRAERDPRVERWDELIEIRGEQVEDWLALGLFLSLLGATDALVAAHMADYPEPLTIRVGPSAHPGGGWRLGLSLPFDRPRSPGR